VKTETTNLPQIADISLPGKTRLIRGNVEQLNITGFDVDNMRPIETAGHESGLETASSLLQNP